MYYRVAIHIDQNSGWKWKSTALTSLESLFQFLRLYRALPQDQLRVFSSSSCEEMDALLARENACLESGSVTAAQFLHERRIALQAMTVSAPEGEAQEQQIGGSSVVSPIATLNESNTREPLLQQMYMSALDRKRLDVERGSAGDHDIPYTFSLPVSMPQQLAWAKLLAKVHAGELES